MMRTVDACAMALSYIELSVTPPLDTCKYVPISSILTTANSNINDTVILLDLLGLVAAIPAESVFMSEDGELSFTLTRDHAEGETTLDVYPLMDNIPSGTRLFTTYAQKLYSIGELISEIEDTTVEDRIFGESFWASSKVVSRKLRLSVRGTIIIDDPGLALLKESVFTNKPFYLETFYDTANLPNKGYAFVGKYKEDTIEGENKKVTLDLIFVSLNSVKYNETYILVDQDDNPLTDQSGNILLS